jgi:deoxycytidine triphosphate deaminase
MTTLSRKGLDKYFKRDKDPLIITPILSPRQIGEASLDVRLGNQFLVFRTHRFGIFEAIGMGDKTIEPRKIQERQVIPFGERLVLHPGVLVLACTFEYVSIPGDLECQVEGRSSWARLGLQVATATSIEPGFKGVITLELSNVATVPLALMPGIRIAQLLLRKAEPPVDDPYSGNRKYRCPIGPEFSRLHEDYDWNAFAIKKRG